MAGVLDIANEVYRGTRDRSGWIEGPWDEEPWDKVVWVDPETDLDCMIVRNYMGGWCGYVGVGPGHPLHGVSYGECIHRDACDRDEDEVWCRYRPDSLVDVHGGLTFSDLCVEDGDPGSSICHIAQEGRPERVWWFGFDCGHAWDTLPYIASCDAGLGRTLTEYGSSYKPMDYVINETIHLARQLVAMQ